MSTLTVQINENDIKGTNTDSGFFLDEIAKALGLYTSMELEESNLDYMFTNVDYFINDFDYESAFIEYLNENPDSDVEVAQIDSAARAEFESSDLKLGAWLALNRPELFEGKLEAFKDDEQENARNHEQTLSKLLDEVEEAEGAAQEELYHEWLHGDRGELGLLGELSRRLFEERYHVEYTPDKRYLTISATADEMVGFMELDDDEANNLTNVQVAERFKIEFVAWVERTAYNNVQKDSADTLKRTEEYKRQAAYKAEQEAKKVAARVARLNAMRKEG